MTIKNIYCLVIKWKRIIRYKEIRERFNNGCWNKLIQTPNWSEKILNFLIRFEKNLLCFHLKLDINLILPY